MNAVHGKPKPAKCKMRLLEQLQASPLIFRSLKLTGQCDMKKSVGEVKGEGTEYWYSKKASRAGAGEEIILPSVGGGRPRRT